MIEVLFSGGRISGMTAAERVAREIAGMDIIRQAEVTSIRRFVTEQRHLLGGRLLDFGAGKPGTCRVPQPYRGLCSGEYHPMDVGDPWPDGEFDVILCTQVLHLVGPVKALEDFYRHLRPGGVLVMTYPTNWDEVEKEDLWRYTQSGMNRLLVDRGFNVLHHELRAAVRLAGFSFPLGHGVIARKPL